MPVPELARPLDARIREANGSGQDLYRAIERCKSLIRSVLLRSVVVRDHKLVTKGIKYAAVAPVRRDAVHEGCLPEKDEHFDVLGLD